ncbi:hypothetical protein HanRHA438_Chr15g0708681 [Helianthus annuus]|uniref:Uncharacterized protein n=1 Tax=Helianthus annuus TaxID=4232 RepID=A0A251S8U5_HELAN|nr:hypothetical protein HanXRQr2_Chr15g0696261 [Helianthus annuus]KAJ0451441.1 hypothetical protein HanHA300_Chr15g0567551 [Helianthus annuus]KAJ0455952.1 hypothetical protein HanIR_Chr15g0756891 [Helianthus annuus]KAJ0473318.1 hypothetical protein HanHA89_Chr15g0616931 [Helianthus annuus]KAJ0648900.1 hypothetical protein HanLR1_Chr15g0578061 [Helianthus annuus]
MNLKYLKYLKQKRIKKINYILSLSHNSLSLFLTSFSLLTLPPSLTSCAPLPTHKIIPANPNHLSILPLELRRSELTPTGTPQRPPPSSSGGTSTNYRESREKRESRISRRRHTAAVEAAAAAAVPDSSPICSRTNGFCELESRFCSTLVSGSGRESAGPVSGLAPDGFEVRVKI